MVDAARNARDGSAWVAARLTIMLTGLVLTSMLVGCTTSSPSSSSSAGGPSSPVGSPAPSGSGVNGASGGIVVEPTHGLEITFPSGWVVLVPSSAADATALAALKDGLGAQAGIVDELVGALAQHPEYWFVAARVSDQNVAIGELRTLSTAQSWRQEQEAALQKAFGVVQTVALASPRSGTAFTFTAQGVPTRVYGFDRAGGEIVFTFTAVGGSGPGPGWDDIIATFTDDGR